MKISEITTADLLGYLRLDDSGTDVTNELETLLKVAKAFITSYTGLTLEAADLHEDFVIVVFVLVQDMYDNRTLYVDKTNLNKVVETILGMHSVNLL